MISTSVGCDECKGYWQKSPKKRPEPSDVNMELQVSLVVCMKCGSLWEESQRLARIIDLNEAKIIFKRYFKR